MSSSGPDAPDAPGGLISAELDFSAVDGPGNRYVVFLQGCQFDCLVCHNPCTIPRNPVALQPEPATALLERIALAAPFITGVTVTGGEATLQAPFVAELFTLLAADPRTTHLTRLVDSNGDCDPEVWQLLAPVMHGAMLDLKALDDDMHYVLTAASNVRVLESVRTLAAMHLLHEVRLLLVPGLNDSDAQLREVVAWLGEHAPGTRIRRNLFRRQGARPCARDIAEADDATARHYATLVPPRAPVPSAAPGASAPVSTPSCPSSHSLRSSPPA